MAEKQFDAQVNYGWGLSLNMTGKAPAVAKRIFNTYEDAKTYVNDYKDSAIVGLVLSVVEDEDATRNGLYFVKQIGTSALEGELVKVGETTNVINSEGQLQEFIKEENVGKIFYLAQDLLNYTSGIFFVKNEQTIQKLGEGIIKVDSDASIATVENNSVFYLKYDTAENTQGLYLKNNSGAISKILDQKEIQDIINNSIAEIIADAPESFDTLKEIADWISTGGSNAAELLQSIKQLETTTTDDGIVIKGTTHSGGTSECDIPIANSDNIGLMSKQHVSDLEKAKLASGTVLKKSIKIDGGPLASYVKGVFHDNEIKEDTSVEEVLRLLFNKIQFPTVAKTGNNNPSITLSGKDKMLSGVANNLIKEVKSTATFNVNPSNLSVVLTPDIIKYSNMSYGYRVIDGAQNQEYPNDTIYTQKCTQTNQLSDSYITIGEYTYPMNAEYRHTVVDGVNTITARGFVKGTFSIENESIPIIQVRANNGEYTVNNKYLTYENIVGNSASKTELSIEVTYTIYGVRPIKFNGISVNNTTLPEQLDKHDGTAISSYTPGGTYKRAGNTITLYINYGDSTAANTTGDKAYKLFIPTSYNIISLEAYELDPSKKNPWDDSTSKVDSEIENNTTELEDGIVYTKYTFDSPESKCYGIKVIINWT